MRHDSKWHVAGLIKPEGLGFDFGSAISVTQSREQHDRT